jgi:dihydrofolate synthase / folylpolyglutamate synthase
MPSESSSLASWLDFLEQLHPSSIELGLERVSAVANKLNLQLPEFNIAIAGTNGKGSVSALLQYGVLNCAKTVGTYTSPHIFTFNERIKINGVDVTDTQLIAAFSLINQQRGAISLSYFEFATLAAMVIFADAQLDIAIWEVGLGGRLDAVNIIDADMAIITSIALDHQEWLGDTCEQIGYEKAGIFRAGQLAICGEKMPKSVKQHSARLATQLYALHNEYAYTRQLDSWDWFSKTKDGQPIELRNLPISKLHLNNLAIALQALNLQGLLTKDLAVAMCQQVALTGRMQLIGKQPQCILDIAHNPQAVDYLAQCLANDYPHVKLHAIVSILDDKAALEIFTSLAPLVAHWYLVDSSHIARGQTTAQLANALAQIPSMSYSEHSHISSAYTAATSNISDHQHEKLLVTGSFYIVAQALSILT